MSLKRICVFCGSRPGVRPEYVARARELGAELAIRGIGIVYGGASVGTMGALANAALEAGGAVIGVIPRALVDREIAHRGLTELRVVESMHERKAEMEQLSDGFIALPGGFGTLEEVLEIITWSQLGLHRKPIGFLDVGGFYAPLRDQFARGVEEGFIPHTHVEMMVFDDVPGALVERVRAWEAPAMTPKWVDRSET
jgi:uncharacterized protein (TIGR00730 family)